MRTFILDNLQQIIESYEEVADPYYDPTWDFRESLQTLVSDLRCLHQNIQAMPTYCPDCKVMPLEKMKAGLWCSKCMEIKEVES